MQADITLAIFGTLAGMLVLGVPIGYALGLATVAGLLLSPIPMVYLSQTFYTGAGLFPLIAIPGFILAGELMIRSGITDKIVRVLYIMVGRLPGGLGFVTVLGCAFFASLSGSGPATTAAIGSVMIPAMVKAGYPVATAAALAATGGTLGILIPPSNPMIIYGVIANISVSGLFLSGVLPGLLITGSLALYCYILGRLRGYRIVDGESFSWRALGKAVWDGKWALLMPVLVLGSIYTSMATPTESSMLAVVYTFLTGMCSRRLTLRMTARCIVSTASLTGAVLIIMGPAMAFGRLLVMYEIPAMIANSILAFTSSPTLILFLICGLLVIVGMFMETLSTIVLLTPIFLPLLLSLGVDPAHFGILFVVVSQVGFLTPPLGVNLFVASALSGASLERIARAVLPLILLLLGMVVFFILVPWVSTVGYHFFVN